MSVRSLAASPDGRFLYAGIPFRRDPNTGALAYVRGGDEAIPSRDANSAVALGANGRSLYVASGRSTVARFRVRRATGTLRFDECVTGTTTIDGTHCTPIATATRDARKSGLYGISALAASSKTLYAAAERDGSIATFALAPQTRIRNGPSGEVKRQPAVLKFRASEPSKFRCKLEGGHVRSKLGHWRRCGSQGFRRNGREVYRDLEPGGKVFKVRASDRAHTGDPTPAKRRWRVD
jgi:hypothetical protein